MGDDKRLSDEERALIMRARNQYGAVGVAEILGVSRHSVAWAAAGADLRRSTISAIRYRLPQLSSDAA